jgi:hypothetical protein
MDKNSALQRTVSPWLKTLLFTKVLQSKDV